MNECLLFCAELKKKTKTISDMLQTIVESLQINNCKNTCDFEMKQVQRAMQNWNKKTMKSKECENSHVIKEKNITYVHSKTMFQMYAECTLWAILYPILFNDQTVCLILLVIYIYIYIPHFPDAFNHVCWLKIIIGELGKCVKHTLSGNKTLSTLWAQALRVFWCQAEIAQPHSLVPK